MNPFPRPAVMGLTSEGQRTQNWSYVQWLSLPTGGQPVGLDDMKGWRHAVSCRLCWNEFLWWARFQVYEALLLRLSGSKVSAHRVRLRCQDSCRRLKTDQSCCSFRNPTWDDVTRKHHPCWKWACLCVGSVPIDVWILIHCICQSLLKQIWVQINLQSH